MPVVLQVWFKPHATPTWSRSPFELIEFPHPDALEAMAALDEERLVTGSRLLTHKGEGRGERVVHDAVAIGIRGSAVDRVELPTWRLVREVEEAE